MLKEWNTAGTVGLVGMSILRVESWREASQAGCVCGGECPSRCQGGDRKLGLGGRGWQVGDGGQHKVIY